jgi:hypothetical protein
VSVTPESTNQPRKFSVKDRKEEPALALDHVSGTLACSHPSKMLSVHITMDRQETSFV